MILESEHRFFGAPSVVKEKRLDNGLRVLLLRDPSAPLVAVQLWYRVGSRDETPGKTGMAHLFEHLMFNETEHLAPGEFDRKLEAVGADTNAATWVDWTYYRENVPREHLELALTLEADRLANLVIRDPQVSSEREVVANERRFRVDDDVEGFLGEQLMKLAFTEHPYRWPTIGWMEDIVGFTTDDARAFHRTWYAPNNATLVLVGDFAPAEADEQIERCFGGLAKVELPPERAFHEPAQRQPRRAVFGKPVAADRLLVGYRGPGASDPAHAAVEVAVELLAGGQSARLYRRMIVETELASDVHAHAPEFRDPGLIEFQVSLQRGRRAAEAEAILDEELARLATDLASDREIEKSKRKIEARLWHSLRPQEGKAEALGHHQTTVGDYRALFSVAERVQAVDAGAVRAAAERFFAPSQRSTVVAEPARRRR